MREPTLLEKLLLVETDQEAENLLKEIIRSDPTNVVACLKLGDILRNKGQYIDALKLHKSLLINSSYMPVWLKEKVYVSIIKDYLGANKPALTLQFIGDLRKLGREDIEFLKFLCSLYEDLSAWEEAIQLKQRILKLTDESDDRGIAVLYAFWGNSLIKDSSPREGVKRLKEALRFDSFCLPALLFLGDFHYESGEIDEGIRLWEEILTNVPDYAFLVFERLENAYYRKHEMPKLETLYSSFLARSPENVSVLLLLSEIYEKKGQDREAIEILEKAREIEPQNVQVHKRLLKLYYDTKQYDRTFEEGEKISAIVDFKPFKCYKCGIKFDEFKFKCPECNSWITIR